MHMRFCIAAAAAAILFSSCSDDPVGTGGTRPAEYSQASLEFYGSDVDALWGRSASDLYLSGSILAHYDGDKWDLIEFPRNAQGIRSIFPGENGTVNWLGSTALFRYEESTWERIPLPSEAYEYLSADDGQLYIANGARHFWKFDGASWSELDSLPDLGGEYYSALAGDGHDNIFASASDGSIAHFDGVSWTMAKSGNGRGVGSAWKDPDGPLYVATWYDTLYTFDGTNLTPVDFGPEFRAQSVYGNAPAELYVRGYDYHSGCAALRKRQGNNWVSVACDGGFSDFTVWGAESGESFVATRNVVLRIHGDSRETLLGVESDRFGLDPQVYDMWGTESEGIVAVGAIARRYFEGQWIDLHKEEITNNPAYSVWGTSMSNLWAVGSAMILHYDGDDWTWVSGAAQQDMRGVWCSDDEVIAVGRQGAIMRYRGDEWEAMASGTSYDLSAVWGWKDGAFAAGEDGAILRYDGDDWQIEDSPINWFIYDLFGLAPNNIWAVGESTLEICHYDGRNWTPQEIMATNGDLVSIWATSSQNVFVANGFGAVLRFDGDAWSILPRYLATHQCLWGNSRGELLVGGSGIVRFQR